MTTLPVSSPLVPSLDALHERGRDLVWCAALPLAWEALRTLVGGKVTLRDARQPAGAAALVAALEAQPAVTGEVKPTAFVAAAGVADSSWEQHIAERLREQFGPDTDARLPEQSKALTAYAYLTDAWVFRVPLCRTYGWFHVDGATFDSFGLWDSMPPSPLFDARAEQVLVHHYRLIRDGNYVEAPEDDDDPIEEWVVELLPEDSSDRVFVSRCRPGATLADTATWVWSHTQRDPGNLQNSRLTRADRFEAPCLDVDLVGDLPALHGAVLEQGAAGTNIVGNVRQRLRFRLDEGAPGARAEARLAGLYLPPRNLTCDGPFLLLVQRRAARVPTLAAWIETPALLVPRAPRKADKTGGTDAPGQLPSPRSA